MKSLRNSIINCDIEAVIKADKIPGGLADKKKPSDFDPDALAAGVKIEMEHTSSKQVATEIAMDHLTEDPNYYKKLKTIEKGKDGSVASVGVTHGTYILMGKRRDNGRWTLPGGHLEPGEDALEGAKREAMEEAGLKLDKLKKLSSKKVTTHKGKEMTIHAFTIDVKQKPSTSMKQDPDQEVERWQWIETKDGLPDEVKNNLHSPKNTVLQGLGLLKGEQMYVGGFYIPDLIKARPHKYLRKYKGRNGKWIYVYHEGDQHGRVIPEEAVNAIHAAAEKGHEGARALRDSMEEHHPEKLNLLRQLADKNAGEASKMALKQLKRLGIDREQERLEEAVTPQRGPMEQDMSKAQKTRAVSAIGDALDRGIFSYLQGHTNTPFYTRLRENNINLKDVMDNIKRHDNLHDMLKELDKQMKRIDEAHAGLPVSRNSSVASAGGYGNYGYREALKALQKRDLTHTEGPQPAIVPPNYTHERGQPHDQERFGKLMAAEQQATQQEYQRHQEQIEGERRQREREQREMEQAYETHRESVDSMSNYFGAALNDADKRNLAKNIQKFFGSNFKFDRFVQHLQGHPEIEIEVSRGFFDGLRGGSNSLGVSFTFKTDTGRRVTSASRTVYKKDDGSIHWANGALQRASNADLKKYPGMATGLYGGVENFLREITADWEGPAKENTKVTIGTAANSGFGDGYKGALVWAKHYFDWSGGDRGESASWQSRWKNYSSKINTILGESKAQAFKAHIDNAEYPYQFVNTGIKMNKAQAEQLIGQRLDWDFSQIVQKKGYIDVGELIMIHSGTGWSSENYINKTSGRAGHLNAKRRPGYDKVLPENRNFTRNIVPPGQRERQRQDVAQQEARRYGLSDSERSHVQSYLQYWRPTGRNTSYTITQRRLRTMMRWTDDQVAYFMSNARLTPAAKRRIREARRARS